MLRGGYRAQHASTHKTRGLSSCTHAMSCLAQVQGKRNTYPHHQASPPRWRAPLHYRLCFLPIRCAVQNAKHCCPCFHSAPLADMALRRAGCAARKVTGAERTSEAPSAAGATCSGPGNAGRVREEEGWVDRTKPQTATIFMQCGCSWAAKKACVGLSALWGSMEVFHSGTTRCNTCTRKFYSDFAWLSCRSALSRVMPDPPLHHHPRASSLDLL